MAIPAPLTSAEEVIATLRLTEGEFDWDNRGREGSVSQRVARAIRKAQVKTLQVVGAGNYASTDATTLAAVGYGEFAFTCALMLRERLVILSSRPEEAPPEEYIDLGALEAEILRHERDWQEFLAPYATGDLDKAGTGFSWGATGVDETVLDHHDYEEVTDFGDLPSV